ncbi:MAG: hypothetical protein KGK07_15950 [Chloroflexota bacterium]|nr:hypothetical protein [Chloroflexota bacterium]
MSEHDYDDNIESKTQPSSRFCNHRDLAGDSAVEHLNGGAWCTICGQQQQLKGETA